MKTKLKSALIKVNPKTRQAILVVGALAVLLAVLGVSQTESEPRRFYDKDKDQVMNILTDRSNKNVGLDRMAGQISRLSRQNDNLEKELERLKKEGDRKQAQEEREGLKQKVQALESQVVALKKKQIHLEEEAAKRRLNVMEQPQKGDSDAVEEVNGAPKKVSELVTFTAPQPSSTDKEKARKGNAKKQPIQIQVVGEEVEDKAGNVVNVSDAEEAVAYLPAGSILTGTIITGAVYPTGKGALENPTPTLIRLQKEAILPNQYRSDVRECLLLVGGRGDLSTERAKLRGENLSCIREDGTVLETKLNSYVVGEDGKEGIQGRLVSKQGSMIARTLVAGFASGISQAFDFDPVPVISTQPSGSTQYQDNFSADAMKGGFAKGTSVALERLADYYMDLAEEMFPVVEVNAGRQVDIVVITGTQLHASAKGKI